MLRSLVFGAFLTAATALSASANPLPGDSAGYAKTCSYFQKRAEAQRGGERATWLALLSQSCREALRRLDARTAIDEPDIQTDILYLARLGMLKDVVIGMNVERFTARRSGERGSVSIRKSVTASGEYLIARQIGVMDAFSAWAEASGFDTARLRAE